MTRTQTAAALLLVVLAFSAHAAPRVLLLTKSAGFEHPVVQEIGGAPSVVETVLRDVVEDMGGTLTATKDASAINASNLTQYNLVVFFTTGVLTTTGTDGYPAMGPNGVAELIAWVEGGGGFIGLHCASDTFHPSPPSSPSPYLEFLGAEFARHGAQFTADVVITSTGHPIMQGIPNPWTVHEEWYQFVKYRLSDADVLANLDPGDEGLNQPIYAIPPYPIIWTREPGNGHLVYSAMAHREETWNDPTYQLFLHNAVEWAAGSTAIVLPPGAPAERHESVVLLLGLVLSLGVAYGRISTRPIVPRR